jgi:hypothetical protein
MRINALGNTANDFASDDYIALDGSTNGSRKMKNDLLLEVTAQNALAGNVAPAFDPTKPNDDGGYAYYVGDKVVYGGEVFVFVNNKQTGAWLSGRVRKITSDYDTQGLSNVSIKMEQGTLNNKGEEADQSNRLRSDYIAGKGKIVLPTKFWCSRKVYYNADGSFVRYEDASSTERFVEYDAGGGLVRFIVAFGQDETTINPTSLPFIKVDTRVESDVKELKKKCFMPIDESLYVDGGIQTKSFGTETDYARTFVSGYPMVSVVLDVSRGDLVEVTGTGGDSYRLWCFVSSNDIMQWRSAVEISMDAGVLESPVDGKLVLNFNTNYGYKVRVCSNVGEAVDKVAGECSINTEVIGKSLVTEEIVGSSCIVDSRSIVLAYLESDTETSVKVENANRLPSSYRNVATGSGITWTLNSDGSVMASGTAANANRYWIVSDTSRKDIKAGTYVFKGASAANTKIVMGITGVGEFYANAGESKSVTIPTDTTYYFNLYVSSGATISDAVFRPELTLSDVPLISFEKHKEKTYVVGSEESQIDLFNGYNTISSQDSFTTILKRFKFSQGGFVNLGDYCVGDGVTDDSYGIQNALIDAAGGTLIVPTGTYLFSKTLVVPSNTRVVGQGSSSIFKLAETYSLTAVAWRSGNAANKYPYIMTTQDSENVVLENLVLVGQTGGFVDMNEDGIMLQGTGHKASRLIVHEINYYPGQFTERTCLCPAWGIDLYRANHCIVENVRIYHCGYEDIGVENSENITIRNSSFGDAKQTRVQVHRSSSNVWIDSNEITAEDGGGAYLTLDAPVSLPMKDIFITNNRVYGYVTAVGGGENNVYMIGNYFGAEISRQNVSNTSSNWVIANNHIMRHVVLNVDVVAINGNIIENSLNREYAITLEGTQDSHVAHVGNIVLAGNEINIVTT